MAKVLVGICGSIAAYRSPDFIRDLKAQGHELRVVLTSSASQFVTTKTLETFLGSKVLSNDLWNAEHLGTDHIEGARWADVIVVYGATVKFMAKLRQGFCDDFLTLQISATQAPVVLCPAMNVVMWESPANQENFQILKNRKFFFAGPKEGLLACGEKGLGHIAENLEILKKIEGVLFSDESSFFLNKKVLLSFGAMRTQVDDVRFLQNSSSGRMGLELARSLLKKGAYLHLLAGICDVGVENELLALAKNNPSRIQLMRFEGVSSYEENLKNSFLSCDLFVSAAAVLDFEVESIQGKLERTKRESLSLNVKATQDYVEWAAQNKKSSQKIVAFALESGTWQEAIDRARKKLLRKGADVIVVNRSGVEGEGPFASTNQVLVMNREELGLGDSQHLMPCHSLSKAQAAEYILSQLNWDLEKSEPVLEAR